MSFMLRTVLISEAVDVTCAKILEQNGVTVTTKVGLSKEQLVKELKNFDGLIVRSATKVTADVIEAAENLKVIGRAGTGVDNIDCNAATRNGILVVNAPGGNALSAAELTCGMIVAMSRNITNACASLKSGKWDRKAFMGQELLDKTLGIIGLGRIGREVAQRMQAFGMKTIGFDPLVSPEESIRFGVETYELDKLWPLVDYITVHTPLIPQTKNLINDDVFAKCQKGVKVVNCARGGIIDEEALLRALESGQCGGAGLDVFLEEPPKNTALLHHPKVICTPHLGASTIEAQNRVAVEIADQFVDLLNGKNIMGVVNSPSFCQLLAPVNKPWSTLCQSLGKLAAALMPSGSGDIKLTVSTCGLPLEKTVNYLSTAVLVGLLKQRIKKGINSINAPILAKEAGIQVHKSHINQFDKLPDQCIGSAVIVEISSGANSHSIVGTVAGSIPLLCSLQGCTFQPHLQLFGNLLMCKTGENKDILEKLIGILSKAGIVIHSISISSPSDGKLWYMLNTGGKFIKYEEVNAIVDTATHIIL
uniref:D-3-phosphoglycerate dehydrogenase n=1 Tax=Hadrurus spadix TaxID=141984 RepID=A0A1W7RAQ6_9SCOR